MKRYTVIFQPTGSPVSLAELKEEVGNVLLRLHPRITYKMGEVYQSLEGKLLAEFAVDGKRQLLEQAFLQRVWALPVRYEGLSWGWLIDNEDATIITVANKSIEIDPLKAIAPLESEGEFVLGKRRSRGRYVALIISTLVLLGILIACTLYTKTPWIMLSYAIFFAIFMFVLSDTPLDIRVYGEKIAIRPDGLEVKFWLQSRPQFLEWAKIWGIDYFSPVCTVLSAGGKMRFLLSEGFGCKEQNLLLKTIIARADLRYVEGNFMKLSYRKPDAIESN